MLTAVSGYYDGSYIVMNENIPMQKGQKVIITLDVNETPAQNTVVIQKFSNALR